MCDTINGPGKFEGEPCYAREVYGAMLDGATEIIDYPGERIDVFEVSDEFRAAHQVDSEIVAILLTESEYGFVCFDELSAKGLEDLRKEAEEAEEAEPDEEYNYFLSDDERSIYFCGSRIVGPVDETKCRECGSDESDQGEHDFANAPNGWEHQFDDYACPRDATMHALAEYVKRNGYYPNVWAISDHGNPTLISVLECGCYFTAHDGDAAKHPSADETGEVTP